MYVALRIDQKRRTAAADGHQQAGIQKASPETRRRVGTDIDQQTHHHGRTQSRECVHGIRHPQHGGALLRRRDFGDQGGP